MEYKVIERGNPMNSEEKLFYPFPVWGRQITEDELSEDISFACSVNVSDIKAVLACLTEVLPRHLMKGDTVKLENLGIFRLAFDTKSEKNEEDVSEKNILQAKVLYRPDVKIKNRLKSTTYKKAAASKEE